MAAMQSVPIGATLVITEGPHHAMRAGVLGEIVSSSADCFDEVFLFTHAPFTCSHALMRVLTDHDCAVEMVPGHLAEYVAPGVCKKLRGQAILLIFDSDLSIGIVRDALKACAFRQNRISIIVACANENDRRSLLGL